MPTLDIDKNIANETTDSGVVWEGLGRRLLQPPQGRQNGQENENFKWRNNLFSAFKILQIIRSRKINKEFLFLKGHNFS
jgi:hypothetical protein